MKIFLQALFGLLLGLSALTMTSCRESDTENAAEDAVENVEDAGEEVGDKVEYAGDNAEDAVV